MSGRGNGAIGSGGARGAGRGRGQGNVSIQTADQLFRELAATLISRDDYVDAAEIFGALQQDDIQPWRIPAFREISLLNQKVDASIEAFCNSKAIRIFRELEAFVKRGICKYKKIDPEPATFYELGLGRLWKHPKVRKHFQFCDDVDDESFPTLSTSDVLQCLCKFIGKNRSMQWDENGRCERHFMDYLKLQSRSKRLVGISIDFRSLFFPCQSSVNGQLHKQLSIAKTEYLQSQQAVLKERMHALQLKARVSEDVIFREIETSLFCGKKMADSYLKLLLSIDAASDFSRSLWTMNSTWFECDGFESMQETDQVTPETILAVVQELIDSGKQVRFKHLRKSKIVSVISACVAGYVQLLLSTALLTSADPAQNSTTSAGIVAPTECPTAEGVQPVENDFDVSLESQQTTTAAREIDALIRSHLSNQVATDVPRFALKAMENELSAVMRQADCVELVTAPDGRLIDARVNTANMMEHIEMVIHGYEEAAIPKSRKSRKSTGGGAEEVAVAAILGDGDVDCSDKDAIVQATMLIRETVRCRVLSANTFLGLATSAILFTRTAHANRRVADSANTRPKQSTSKQDRLKALLDKEVTHASSGGAVAASAAIGTAHVFDEHDVLEIGPTKALIQYLHGVEKSLNVASSVPAFDCHGAGSFLSFLAQGNRAAVLQAACDPVLQAACDPVLQAVGAAVAQYDERRDMVSSEGGEDFSSFQGVGLDEVRFEEWLAMLSEVLGEAHAQATEMRRKELDGDGNFPMGENGFGDNALSLLQYLQEMTRNAYLEASGAAYLQSFEQATGGLNFIAALQEASQRDDRIRLQVEELLEFSAERALPPRGQSGFEEGGGDSEGRIPSGHRGPEDGASPRYSSNSAVSTAVLQYAARFFMHHAKVQASETDDALVSGNSVGVTYSRESENRAAMDADAMLVSALGCSPRAARNATTSTLLHSDGKGRGEGSRTLVFDRATTCDRTRLASMAPLSDSHSDSDLHQQALKRLASVPLGESCLHWTLWEEFFAPTVSVRTLSRESSPRTRSRESSPRTRSRESSPRDTDTPISRRHMVPLIDFIVANEAELMDGMENKVLLACPPLSSASSALDCTPLPTVVPSYDALMAAFHSNDCVYVASHCMSASLQLLRAGEKAANSAARASPVVDANESIAFEPATELFLMSLRGCVLQCYETLGAEALNTLLLFAVDAATSLPNRVGQHTILKMLFEVIAKIAKVSFETIEKQSIECVRRVSTKNSIHQCSQRIRALMSLAVSASAVQQTQFPHLCSYAPTFVTSDQLCESHLSPPHGLPQNSTTTSSSDTTAAPMAGGGTAGPTGEVKDVGFESMAASSVSKIGVSEEVDAVAGPGSAVGGMGNGKADRDSNRVQREMVRSLLRRDFDYDDQGNRPKADSAAGRKLRESLVLLSGSLYSADVHFVMELIQNADDNNYDLDVMPSLKVQLYPHSVVVFNNEVGFEEKNIVAICNVGGSTKKGQSGYIGQKGIGFKSVFSISDMPEVHSKGFHVKFDKKVSMIEPIWVEDDPHNPWPPTEDSDGVHFETCFRLKLDDSARRDLAKLTQSLEEVFDEKLILFLNKLEKMMFEDLVRDVRMEHTRSRLGLTNSWTRLRASYENCHVYKRGKQRTGSYTTDSFWLTRRRRLPNPSIRRNDVEVPMTEIALAFKFSGSSLTSDLMGDVDDVTCTETALLDYDDTERDLESAALGGEGTKTGGGGGKAPPKRIEQLSLDLSEGMLPVYAFLPTKSEYFKFIVQGDFVLSTSRESLIENSDWNKMLLNEVPNLFVDVISEMAQWFRQNYDGGEEAKIVSGAASVGKVEATTISTSEDVETAMNEPSQTTCPFFTEMLQLGYMVNLTPRDIIDLLPRYSQVPKVYKGVLDSIYHALRSVPFLPGRSGNWCAPSQLLSVNHLGEFDPGLYITPATLGAATGRQLVKHDKDFELDDELAAALNIPRFDMEVIMKCFDSIGTMSKSASIKPDSGEDVTEGSACTTSSISLPRVVTDQDERKTVLKTLGGLFLALNQLNTAAKANSKTSVTLNPNAASFFASRSNMMIPAQLAVKATITGTARNGRTSAAGGVTAASRVAFTSTLDREIVQKLKRLQIWPMIYTGSGTALSRLENGSIAFVRDGSKESFSKAQEECIEVFQHRFVVLDDSLFRAANELISDPRTKSAPAPGETLRTFLLHNFRPPMGAVASSALTASGGISELTSDAIIRSVIFPAYSQWAVKADAAGDSSAPTGVPAALNGPASGSLDRVTAAAFLAFLHLATSSIGNSLANSVDAQVTQFLKDHSIVVPVLGIHARKHKESVWAHPQLQQLRTHKTNAAAVTLDSRPNLTASLGFGDSEVPATEVHIGVEVRDSATNVLISLPTNTALVQLDWIVVDPLAAGFVFCKTKDLIDNTADRGKRHSGGGGRSFSHSQKPEGSDGDDYTTSLTVEYSTSQIKQAFNSCLEDEMASWNRFLRRIGAVNFFGIYESGLPSATTVSASENAAAAAKGNSVQAPVLSRFLHHLLRNGQRIVTCRSMLADVRKDHSSDSESSDDDDDDGGDDSPTHEEAEVVEYVFGSGETAPGYLPLYLPTSASSLSISKSRKMILSVSKNVFDTMTRVAQLVAQELDSHYSKRSSRPSLSELPYTHFLKQINCIPWFPFTIHHDLESSASTTSPRINYVDDRSKNLFLLAAPRDVIARQEDLERRGGGGDPYLLGARGGDPYLLGAHCAYLPYSIYNSPVYGSIRSYFSFCFLSSRADPELSVVSGLVRWMSLQRDQQLFSKTSFMAWIYRTLFNFFDPTDSDLDESKQEILRCLKRGEPFLWVADTADAAKLPVYCPGKMYALSSIVKEDKSNMATFDESPVKVLTASYDVACRDKNFAKLFSRARCCDSCIAIEGMFGTRGQPKSSQSVALLGAGTPNQCCCNDEGFGQFCKDMPGLVAQSPSIEHVLDILRYHVKSVVDSSAAVEASEEGRHVAHDYPMEVIFKILTTVSSNVWKCFSMRQCLHPYSSAQLNALIQALKTENLLPSFGGVSFVGKSSSSTLSALSSSSLSQRRIIAVDDFATFDQFRDILEPMDSVSWVDCDGRRLRAASMQVAAMKATVDAVIITSLCPPIDSYDPQVVEMDANSLVALPRPEFEARSKFIQPATFFAPKNLVPLMRLLQIPTLTDHVQESWTMDEIVLGSRRPGNVRRCIKDFVDTMNRLLIVAQAFIFKVQSSSSPAAPAPMNAFDRHRGDAPTEDPYQRLRGRNLINDIVSGPRMQQLLKLDTRECKILERELTLTGLDVEGHVSCAESFRLVNATSDGYVLYLEKSMSVDEIRELCVLLVVATVRIEVTVSTRNQEIAFMEDFEKVLRKLVRCDQSIFFHMLDAEDLTVSAPLLADRSPNPDCWRLRLRPEDCTPVGEELQVGAEKTVISGSTEEQTNAGIKGLDRLIQNATDKALKLRNPVASDGVHGPGNDQSTRVTQTSAAADINDEEREQKEKRKRELEELAAKVLGNHAASDVNSLTGAESPIGVPEATGPSGEDSRVTAATATDDSSIEKKVVTYEFAPVNRKLNATGSYVADDSLINFLEREEPVPPPESTVPQRIVSADRKIPAVSWRVGRNETSPRELHTDGTEERIPSTKEDDGARGRSVGGGRGGSAYTHDSTRYRPFLGQYDRDDLQADSADLAITDADLQAIINAEAHHCAAQLDGFSPRSTTSDADDELVLIGNDFSGRTGENIAFCSLRSILAASASAPSNAPTDSTAVVNITWVNEHQESGESYDITVELADGTVKYCEVKTRSVKKRPGFNSAHAYQKAQKWSISPEEIRSAHEKGDRYFCVLVDLTIDYASQEVSVSRILTLGYQRGLVQSIHDSQALLFLQVRSRESGTSQDDSGQTSV